MAQTVKNPRAMWEKTWVRALGQEDAQGRAWQPTPVLLPGESPWAEEPGGLQSTGSEKSWKRLNVQAQHRQCVQRGGVIAGWGSGGGGRHRAPPGSALPPVRSLLPQEALALPSSRPGDLPGQASRCHASERETSL